MGWSVCLANVLQASCATLAAVLRCCKLLKLYSVAAVVQLSLQL